MKTSHFESHYKCKPCKEDMLTYPKDELICDGECPVQFAGQLVDLLLECLGVIQHLLLEEGEGGKVLPYAHIYYNNTILQRVRCACS